jgi:hypothetical protein
MRLLYRVVLGAGLALTLFAVVRFPTRRSERAATPASTDEPVLSTEPTQPVGWVFGRVMGVSGAERPLMSASGSYGGRPSMPATGGGR